MKVKHNLRREPNGGKRLETVSPAPAGRDTEGARPAAGESEVALLAYRYWQERGCPEGCAEDDWFRAERELAELTQAEDAAAEAPRKVQRAGSAGPSS